MSLKEQFGELLESCGQMYWEMDRDLRVIYANRLIKETFGDPVGRICHEFMACSDEVCPACPVVEVLNGRPRATSERKRRNIRGGEVWLQHTAMPIKNQAGEIVGAGELIIDVTHRKEMEEELRESERRYRSLVEQVPDIIFSLDAEGRFVFVNTEMEKFLGAPVHTVLETPLKDHVVPEDRGVVDSLFRLEPESIWDEEIGIPDAAGGRHFARIRCKASYDSRGRITGFEGVMRDRTSRRKLEEELKASKEALLEKIKIIDELYEHIVMSGQCKAIEEHTAEVAHELRQPLAIVGGFARRLEKHLRGGLPLDEEMHAKYVRIIMTEVARLERILERLIDFTRRDKVQLETVSPNELIEYIISVAEARAKERDVFVDARLGSEIGEVSLDPGRFQQLMLNLISNAIEASPVGGTVVVETGASIPSDKALQTGRLQSEGYFEMKVRNSGARIEPDELKQIFNPFYTTKAHGMGLGLTVSKKIVEDHGGSISVRSDDDGTVFTVWLPLTQGGAMGQATATSNELAQALVASQTH
ncbi:MAG: PAS domain S-box protein [Desulfomonile sp.]|nr:PAS domain S-box protein [Desulfomonile sp.]